MGIFKAYDIRGIYGENLNEELAEKIGIAYANFLGKNVLAVSRDVRVSSPSIANALISGISKAGVDVVDCGVCGTPMNYFAIGHYDFPGGVQVTASHNPKQYNGFKLSRENVIPLAFETGIEEIEKRVLSGNLTIASVPGNVTKKDILPDYVKHVHKFAKIKPMKIAVDCGNGTVGQFIDAVFGDLPLEIIPLYFEPDGNFPNHEPNPLKAENMMDLQKAVVENKAALGVAYDGDGDRVCFTDEKGGLISADKIAALISIEMLQREKASVIYDLRSSWVVAEEISKLGGTPIEDRVGHAYIKATMREHNAIFGSELSGHYYYRDNYYADSGDITLLSVLNLLSRTGKSLSEHVEPLNRYFATGEINFEVEDKDAILSALAKKFSDGEVYMLDGVSVKYSDWWFNVRKSNTEPFIRLNLEAKTQALMNDAKDKVLSVIHG